MGCHMNSCLPKIGIVIPSKDHRELLEPCVQSILDLTTYENFEIVIIENNSTDSDIFAYYDTLNKHPQIHVIIYPEKGFNYQRINNFGVNNCDADYILLLNSDIKLLTPNWLELLLDIAQREDTGAVGAALYYPDMSIQHMGAMIWLNNKGGYAGEHVGLNIHKDDPNKPDYLTQIRAVSWVTGACLMVRKSIFEQVGGMDESYEEICGDLDLCMKLRALGKQNMIHPQVELIHYESKTRGYYTTKKGLRKAHKEEAAFVKKWRHMLSDKDPYRPDDNIGGNMAPKKKVSIDKIMTEIRRDITAKHNSGELGSFREFGDGLFEENLDVLSSKYILTVYRPLNSERVLGRIIVFFRKIIRKCISFYIVPIATDQSENNRLMVECIQQLHERVQALEKENRQLKSNGEIEK